MTDVLKHKLVGTRRIQRATLDRAANADDMRKHFARFIGADAGIMIAERYPPTVETEDDGNELHTLTVYVFNPTELAALIAQVREQAMDEFLAVANATTEQENDHDHE